MGVLQQGVACHQGVAHDDEYRLAVDAQLLEQGADRDRPPHFDLSAGVAEEDLHPTIVT